MSSIRLVLSRILMLSSLSMFLSWVGDSSSSKITASISFSAMKSLISCSFPLLMYVLESGLSTFCMNLFTPIAPAVSARNSSSSRYSLICLSSSPCFMTPTNTALSLYISLFSAIDMFCNFTKRV